MVLLFSLWFVNAMPHGKRNVRNHTVFGHLLLITIGIDDLRHGIVVYRKGIVIDDCVCFCIVRGSLRRSIKYFCNSTSGNIKILI